ncbi:CPBP family intramembrane metalloprotease [Romboutsia maritimum]|uniref:CPBP family intramembrane metalloprotease n=1 Tax=Romboutsia maritimum TaxID=2020948 RepID=A0A371IUQ4_9FIRM|nr:type II CAAX endopeptidase family protein [Romboutsia maritimum]RDY24199.1 CPBP family intramembrane metalloprotease [Romboutsia maritimum]
MENLDHTFKPRQNKKLYRNYIIMSSILCATILFIIEQILMVDYLTKTLSKIILFTISPLILIKFIRKTSLKKGLNIQKTDIKTISTGIGLGLVAVGILIGTFMILKQSINMETISIEMATKSKITEANYLIVATYFTLGNSFLEEFFFRGFVFINMFKMGYKKTAYIFSSALFAIYHIGIFKNWFILELIVLCLIGLFLTGIIFDYVDTKSDNFLNSWTIHILADLTIAIIGYIYLF